jgi:hypothetical protein
MRVTSVRGIEAKVLATTAALAAGVFSLTGCASFQKECAVRHHYAIVVFQNGVGRTHRKAITHFRLNVRYGPYVRHRIIRAHIVLKMGSGNPPIAIRSYRVGDARSCSVSQVRGRRR